VQNNFYCKQPFINLYDSPYRNSQIGSQILYGEGFKILKKEKNFIKIKTRYDNYIGYIKQTKYSSKFSSTHKISALKSRIYKYPKNLNKFKSKNFLSFSSKIQVIKKKNNFVMFDKNKWILSKDIMQIDKKEKNFIKILKLFLNCKYKWGGKTYNGIDCSALIQIFYKFNNKFFPRDTVDQIKFKKGNITKNKFKLGEIIYWKGHVAICINSKELIHAYGPRKKVLIMSIKKTIKLIKDTAKLDVKRKFTI
tara:strand:- start:2083 stop:2835 length:753 start_codon:yes stop_codon:yes gene_type:complete